MNGCRSDPCKMGQCIDVPGGFQCICNEGFSGRWCEMPVDKCPEPWMIIGQCLGHKSEALKSYLKLFYGRYMIQTDHLIAASCGMANDPEVNICR